MTQYDKRMGEGGSRLAMPPGKPGKGREFENWPNKLTNFNILSKTQKKSVNIIKLLDDL